MKKGLALMLSVLLALSLLTYAGAESTVEKQYFKIAIGLNDTLSGFKPTTQGGYGLYAQLMFSPLMKFDVENLKYVPALAEKLEVSEDKLTYTVTLRDAKFHDGKAITADDVIFTYNLFAVVGGVRMDSLASVAGYDAVRAGEAIALEGLTKTDEKTIVFTLASPNSLFMDALANSVFGILPRHCFEGLEYSKVPEQYNYWAAPVGSGAYMIDETAYPNYVIWKAFPDFYDPAGVEYVLGTYYADAAAFDAATLAGEIYYSPNSGEEFAQTVITQNSDYKSIVLPALYHRCLWINGSDHAGDTVPHPSLVNPKVRQALNILVDKESAAIIYSSTLATPLTSRINPEKSDYNTNLPAWKYNPTEAKQILDEEGFDYSVPLRIYSDYTDQKTADFFELLKQNFAEVGIKVQATQDSNWSDYLTNGDYDLLLNGHNASNAIQFYKEFMYTGINQYTRNYYPMQDPDFEAYQKARYDALVIKWQASMDNIEKKELLDQLQLNAYEDMYCIPVYALNRVNLYNTAKIAGFPVFSPDYSEIADLHFSDWKLLD